jgi:transposase
VKSLSQDLRERIVAARGRGNSAQEVGRFFGVSKRSVERFWNQYQRQGTVSQKQRGGYRRSRLEGHDQQLRSWIKEKADLTLIELQQKIAQQLNIEVGITALWHRLEGLGLSYKKNATRRRARSTGHSRSTSKVAKRTKKLGSHKTHLSGPNRA